MADQIIVATFNNTNAAYDAAIFHQVLHYADRPSLAIAEAARTLRAQGRLTRDSTEGRYSLK